MAPEAPPRTDEGTTMQSLKDFREHTRKQFWREHDWVATRFEYTFTTHNDDGKQVQLQEITQKSGSHKLPAWVTLKGDLLQFYCERKTGGFEKTHYVLRPNRGYASVYSVNDPFSYIVHESPSSDPDRHVMRGDLHLFVQFVYLFHNKIQEIAKMHGRNLLAEFEEIFVLM
ncbi:hypothetical protein G6514_006580 [Epicoccum nigrum]|nr:hypothetical protein G6514_006580 [Epicoccum nigrum]